VVFYDPTSLFNGSIDGERILIQQDGYTQYLLEAEPITCIMVDQANRKWVGTRNSGIFVLSEDGTEELAHFTSSNSPLFTNSIIDLELDENAGIIYVATEKGLLSYRGSASYSDPAMSSVYTFPNPVTEDYFGPIAIQGLAFGSTVKITDMSGSLIFETVSEGGQAIWNGNSSFGERVSTGVYIVFATDAQGSESAVTKIMVYN